MSELIVQLRELAHPGRDVLVRRLSMSGRETERGIATHNPAAFVGLKGASASGISTMDNGCGLWRCSFVLGAIWEVDVTAREQTW